MSELKLPLSYLRGDHEYVLIDGNKHAIAHALYASDLLRETRQAQIEEIIKRVNGYQKLVEVTRHCARPSNEFDVDAAMLDARELLRSLGEDA